MLNPILCIDSDNESLELLEFALARRGLAPDVCLDGMAGMDRMRYGGYQAIVLGFYLPGRNGPDLCRDLRAFDKKTPVLFYTGAASAKERKEAIEAGAQYYFTKPNDFDQLCSTLTSLVQATQNHPI